MNYDRNKVHYVVVTGILVKNGKYLITKIADWENAFPGKWTVPGGKLEVLDYVLRQRDTNEHWYNIFEELLRREIKEETGLEINNLGYVTSMVYIRSDKVPCIIVSLYAEPVGDMVRLCDALTEYTWVDLNEAKNYDLIEGIYQELEILDKYLKKGQNMVWGQPGQKDRGITESFDKRLNKKHIVTVTAFIKNNARDKFLVVKRHKNEIAYPGKWAFPGGKVERGQSVLDALKQEVMEEVGLEIEDSKKFLKDFTFVRPDGINVVGFFFFFFARSENVKISEEFDDFEWITPEELCLLDHIPGMDEEVKLAFGMH